MKSVKQVRWKHFENQKARLLEKLRSDKQKQIFLAVRFVNHQLI